MAVMESFFLFLFQGIAILFAKEDSTYSRSALFTTKENKRLGGHAVKQFRSPTQISCSLSCLRNSWCTSTNFEEPFGKDDKGTCELNKHGILDRSAQFYDKKGFTFSMMLKGCLMKGCRNGGSCMFREKNRTFSCSCEHPWTGDDCGTIGWTLIARFSNSDGKNWMRDDGNWWYDQKTAIGATNDPSVNNDMISTTFWSVSGKEIKITRSDDPSHTPLLQTIGNCLGGQTFRSKITSYGDFRNGTVWASDQCLGNCSVQYGGHYKSTDGFQKAECSGNIQSANKIGFWCDWDTGDGSVMMIGGGGRNCERADHGIGIYRNWRCLFC